MRVLQLQKQKRTGTGYIFTNICNQVFLLIVSINVLLIVSSTSTFWFSFVFRPAFAIIRVTALVTYTSPRGGQWRVRKPLLASLVQRNTLLGHALKSSALHLTSISKAF
jgi:hypothetical protein